MLDLPLAAAAALELRYDGPIPRQYAASERAARRRDRGTVAVLETQAAAAIDAALRCEADAEELAAELRDGTFGAWQRVSRQNCLTTAAARADAHFRNAVEALRVAAGMRQRLGLALHPVVRISRALAHSSGS